VQEGSRCCGVAFDIVARVPGFGNGASGRLVRWEVAAEPLERALQFLIIIREIRARSQQGDPFDRKGRPGQG
jgi:hypothetical protein